MKRMLAVCGLLLATSAQAQSTGSFELERLQLDPSARGSLVIGTGEVAPAHSFRLSAGIGWQRSPLVLVGSDDVLGRRRDDAATNIVKNRTSAHLTFDYVLLPRVEVYARGTFVLDQTGGPGVTLGETTAWGMPSFGLRLGLLQQTAGAPMNVAIAGEFFPPWGTRDAIARFDDPAGAARLEIGRDMGAVVFGAQAGVLMRKKQDLGLRTYGSEAQGGVVLALKGALRPEVSFRGAVGLTGDRGPGSAELLAGLRYVGAPVELFALGGPGFFNRPGTPEWRALAGFAARFDAGKKAPPPAPAPAPVAKPEPAPAPPVKKDPCAAGEKHTPEQCPDLDDDGDGIANKADACPLEKGIAELKGCPAKDADKDGVPDHLDRCPNEAGPADNQGCPRVVVQKETKKIELREKVQFETGKSVIRPESASLLDEVAKVMKDHAEIKKVVIEGHTDSTGGKAFNQKLSEARAGAVMKALVQRGVEAGRLSAKGFGPSKPIAPNTTAEGREANRRVEISIAEQTP
jgi:OmpA-OmpF porin, OOP family